MCRTAGLAVDTVDEMPLDHVKIGERAHPTFVVTFYPPTLPVSSADIVRYVKYEQRQYRFQIYPNYENNAGSVWSESLERLVFVVEG
jgi:hypothetical protein